MKSVNKIQGQLAGINSRFETYDAKLAAVEQSEQRNYDTVAAIEQRLRVIEQA